MPLSLVYRLDSFGRNGLNPALLMVYGAYGTKYDPEFDSRLLSLLDRGERLTEEPQGDLRGWVLQLC